MRNISFKLKGKKFDVIARDCGFFGRVIGLMFKFKESADAIVFSFDNPTDMGIHSLFVFFPFLAIWIDEQGKAIEIKTIRPFKLFAASKKPYKKLLEIPLNKKYEKIVNSIISRR